MFICFENLRCINKPYTMHQNKSVIASLNTGNECIVHAYIEESSAANAAVFKDYHCMQPHSLHLNFKALTRIPPSNNTFCCYGYTSPFSSTYHLLPPSSPVLPYPSLPLPSYQCPMADTPKIHRHRRYAHAAPQQ